MTLSAYRAARKRSWYAFCEYGLLPEHSALVIG